MELKDQIKVMSDILTKVLGFSPNGEKVAGMLHMKKYYSLIFDHEFAKQIWGEDLLCYDCGEKVDPPLTIGDIVQIGTGQCSCARQFENNFPAYEYHLSMMVTCSEPLEYLKDFA